MVVANIDIGAGNQHYIAYYSNHMRHILKLEKSTGRILKDLSDYAVFPGLQILCYVKFRRCK